MILAGLQCGKRCQFNNCFVFFCHGELMASKTTPTKCVQSEITKNADDFCRVCPCSFNLKCDTVITIKLA